MAFKRQATDMGMVKKAKSMKIGKDEKLDQVVFVWFKQKRAEGAPISSSILCEKAVQLCGLVGNSNFKPSRGWRWRFCKRHGIRELSLQGEKLSADKDAADKFITGFKKVYEEKCLSLHQIFYCDET